MLMATDKGNLQQVHDAIHPPAPTIEETRQPHPFQLWYMVLVRPSREQDAADSFRRNHIRAYWPNYEHMQTYRPRKNGGKPEQRMVLTAIVPGYVFSPGSPMEDFETLIERISGVINIVRTFSGKPLMLTQDHIHAIRQIEADQNTPQPAKTVHTYKTGQKVRFIDDLMSRIGAGRISKLAKDGRIGVEVDLMGRKVPFWVFPHQIERA